MVNAYAEKWRCTLMEGMGFQIIHTGIRLRVFGQAGRWDISLTNKQVESHNTAAIVFALPARTAKWPTEFSIGLSRKMVTDTQSQPVAVTASLSRGDVPLLDSTVTAIVTVPGGNSALHINLPLYDNGVGEQRACQVCSCFCSRPSA